MRGTTRRACMSAPSWRRARVTRCFRRTARTISSSRTSWRGPLCGWRRPSRRWLPQEPTSCSPASSPGTCQACSPPIARRGCILLTNWNWKAGPPCGSEAADPPPVDASSDTETPARQEKRTGASGELCSERQQLVARQADVLDVDQRAERLVTAQFTDRLAAAAVHDGRHQKAPESEAETAIGRYGGRSAKR